MKWQAYFRKKNGKKIFQTIFYYYLNSASSQLAFYVNLHRAVIGPSATLTGRWRPDIDLRRMLTGLMINCVMIFFTYRTTTCSIYRDVWQFYVTLSITTTVWDTNWPMMLRSITHCSEVRNFLLFSSKNIPIKVSIYHINFSRRLFENMSLIPHREADGGL